MHEIEHREEKKMKYSEGSKTVDGPLENGRLATWVPWITPGGNEMDARETYDTEIDITSKYLDAVVVYCAHFHLIRNDLGMQSNP
jgi:hypothetical protein